MRKLAAETGNRSTELVLDMLYFAEDVFVRLFLNNIFVHDKLEYPGNSKRVLIIHLCQCMNKSIETHITNSEEFLQLKRRYDKNTPLFIPSVPFTEDVYLVVY